MMIEVNGMQFTNFVKGQCNLSLDSLSSSFEFELSANAGQTIPFMGGQECVVYVDGEKVLTGNIEIWDEGGDAEDHTILISGRDRTADLLDSTLGVIDNIRADNLTLKDVIQIVLDHLGLDIQVIDEVSPEPFNAAEDLISPEPADNAFKFIEKYARKRQVLITSDADGNIVIANNSGIVAEGAVQRIANGVDNNVISGRFTYDSTGRFNRYIVGSQGILTALNLAGDSSLASVTNQSSQVIDSDIRAARQLYQIADAVASEGSGQLRAQWEADIRRARGLIYNCVVDRFRVGITTGDIWRLNRLYRIVDDYIGKVETMLCNSIIFRMNEDEGRSTQLVFVGRQAYRSFLPQDQDSQVSSRV